MINVMLASVYNYLMGDGLPFYGLSGNLLSVENTTKSVIFFFYTTNIKSIGLRFMPLKVILSVCYSG